MHARAGVRTCVYDMYNMYMCACVNACVCMCVCVNVCVDVVKALLTVVLECLTSQPRVIG